MAVNNSVLGIFPETYGINFEALAQQMQSQLASTVMNEPFTGKSKDINQIGKASWGAILARAQETQITETPLGKRRLFKAPFDKADLFDEWDEDFLGQISLPRSDIMMAHVYGWNRLQDFIICTAALGNSYTAGVDPLTGLELQTTVALPTAQKVAINYVETGSTANSSLTVGKLRQAKFILDDADNDDTQVRVCVITAKELQSLLRFTEVTSADYAAVKALVDGQVDTFMGFKFKRVSSVDVLPAVSGVRNLPCYLQSGIKLSTAGPKSYMDIRIDKSNALQLRGSGLVGAVRMEEVKVVQIACDTTLA